MQIRLHVTVLVALLVGPLGAAAEVTAVRIATRERVASGQPFGSVGAYEKLAGTISFAVDPNHPRNKAIADIDVAARGADGRVHFTADLYVLQPVDQARSNGVLLFEIANRGRILSLGRFNRAAGSNGNDPVTAEALGDGFLMKAGYTLVWVGWQIDVTEPGFGIEAPAVDLQGRGLPDTARVSFIVDARRSDAAPADLPRYPPVVANDPAASLTVRDLYWDRPTTVPRSAWRFTVSDEGRPGLTLDAGFEPGRVYELTYRARGARAAGVGLAAIRDAASAFVHRTDLQVRGRSAYVFGVSQSGRFLRQFLHDGFNVDEQDRRVFDAIWAHIAGAGQGSFNERLAMPGYSSFPATRFPFTDEEQRAADGRTGGILARYRPEHRPKVFYTNTSVEYWGQGRAAALTHTSLDGTRDLTLPPDVRMYLLAGTQHGEAAFPPPQGPGQQLGNPVPQNDVMRALLEGLHRWVRDGVAPPASRYPRLADGTLVRLDALVFPKIPGVPDPRAVEGPRLVVNGSPTPLPFLVPQVDVDGNEVGGIRVPDQAVPLATTTGWNFRSERVGGAATIYALLGSYIPFASTREARTASGDPRPSVAERYRGREEYLERIRTAAAALVAERYLREEDVPNVLERAEAHWELAARPAARQTSAR